MQVVRTEQRGNQMWGLVIVGGIALWLLMRNGDNGDGGGGGGGGTTGAVELGASLNSVQVSQPVEKSLGDVIEIAINWTPQTVERLSDGSTQPIEWDYRIHTGVGRPEAPQPGRQFLPDWWGEVVPLNGVMSGNSTNVFVDIPLGAAADDDAGIRDAMVSITARPSPDFPDEGDEVGGVFPFDTEFREVAAQLVQDAVMVVLPTGASLGASINSVNVSQRRRRLLKGRRR